MGANVTILDISLKRLEQLDKMPGSVPRTSTIALTNATLKYGLEIAKAGLEETAKRSTVIASGVNTWDGCLTNRNVAEAHGIDCVSLPELLG